jgi:hypothetical protein
VDKTALERIIKNLKKAYGILDTVMSEEEYDFVNETIEKTIAFLENQK